MITSAEYTTRMVFTNVGVLYTLERRGAHSDLPRGTTACRSKRSRMNGGESWGAV